jgi:hypothetical protein
MTLDGTGTLAFADDRTKLYLRPGSDEGDHPTRVELVVDEEACLVREVSVGLLGTGKVIAGRGATRFVVVDSVDGCIGWKFDEAGHEQPLGSLIGGDAQSAALGPGGACIVWCRAGDGYQPWVWEGEAWQVAGELRPVATVLGLGSRWLTEDGAGVWSIIEPDVLELGDATAQRFEATGERTAIPNSSRFCAGKLVDIIHVKDLAGVPMRYRVEKPSPGALTEFREFAWSTDINRPFHETCMRWASNVRWHFYHNSPYDEGVMRVAWIGSVGVKSCKRYTSAHNRARGFDLCAIRFTNGWYLDCNNAWNEGAWIGYQRRYLGVWASLRRKFVTVLTNVYDREHHNHVHFDNLSPLPPIRKSVTTDTKLVQVACNLLDDVNLVVDGDWGPKTSAAYDRLLAGINETSVRVDGDPFTNRSAADQLLLGIQNHGISNSSLGQWPGYKIGS